jgi:hypothetical protein
MLTGDSRFYISTPLWFWTCVPRDGKQTSRPLDQWDMVRMHWDCRLSTWFPPQPLTLWLWSWKEDLQRAWNQDRRAVWSSWSSRLTRCQRKVWWSTHWPMNADEAAGLHIVGVKPSDSPIKGQRSQWSESCRGHQYSETTLTGESRFHISTPLGFRTWVPRDRKQMSSPLDQWDMVRMKWDCRLSTKPY